jgi:antigen flippase
VSCDDGLAAVSLEESNAGRPDGFQSGTRTYGQILRSTALIGGSSVVNVGFGIVRTKLIALLLGPAGFGLMGLYSSVAELTQSVAGMGIQSSGVRQIAEAVGSEDQQRIARTATVLRRVAVVFGLLGGLALVLFCRPISKLTFGDDTRAAGIALLSIAVLFREISVGQGALIQGMRRIGDLARLNVLGALLSTVISIPLVYYFREKGIVPSLVAIAGSSILASWWYSQKIQIERPRLTLSQVVGESSALIKLGFAFMASGFLTMGAAYSIRIIVLRRDGFEAAGLYQAAWVLGGLYVGFILQAMGADFYPRLTGVSKDNALCNRLVNEQAQISWLLAGPGVVATLTLAPVIVTLFYSSAFGSAVELLRWVCLGMTLRVVAFPMGYIILAKGAQKIFFWTEVAATAVHVGLAWGFVRQFGVNGAGAAFFGLYVWHSTLIYIIVRRLTGFRWSQMNWNLGRIFLPAIGLLFLGFYILPFWVVTIAGAITTVITGLYSLRGLVTLVPVESVPRAIRPWLSKVETAFADTHRPH